MDQEQLQASLLSMGAEHCEVYIDPLMNPKCTVWDIVDEYLTRLFARRFHAAVRARTRGDKVGRFGDPGASGWVYNYDGGAAVDWK
jgi:hypothetical protein